MEEVNWRGLRIGFFQFLNCRCSLLLGSCGKVNPGGIVLGQLSDSFIAKARITSSDDDHLPAKIGDVLVRSERTASKEHGFGLPKSQSWYLVVPVKCMHPGRGMSPLYNEPQGAIHLKLATDGYSYWLK